MEQITKLLLALLAVIGGFALDTAPAQARVGEAADVSEVERGTAAEAGAAVIASSMVLSQALPTVGGKLRVPVAAVAGLVLAPNVRLTDRPRE